MKRQRRPRITRTEAPQAEFGFVPDTYTLAGEDGKATRFEPPPTVERARELFSEMRNFLNRGENPRDIRNLSL